MDTQNLIEKKSLIINNSSNFYTEKELIEEAFKKLSSKCIIDKTDIVRTAEYIQIPTSLSPIHNYNDELHTIVKNLNAELIAPDETFWVVIKRPNYVIPIGAYGAIYLSIFIFYMYYYLSGTSGQVLQAMQNSFK